MINLPQQFVFGLDIGTRSIVGTVGYRNSEKEFIVAAQKTRFHETRAIIDGQIHDIEKVAETIGEIKRELEAEIDRKLTDVCIAAAGRVLKTVEIRTDFDFETDTVVTDDSIRALVAGGVEQAYEKLNSENPGVSFSCVGHSVERYYLNGYLMTEIEAHKAKTIGADIIATFLPQEVVDSLYASVEKAGLNVVAMTLEPIAAINVAIPVNYRLLNIALVDVGAGTSDISITKDGSIIAYGMIPMAGDKITEHIMQTHLTDFATAENIKLAAVKKREVTYKDIIGISHKTASSTIKNEVQPVIEEMTDLISEKIKELNGGKTVSAVFVVGGGGKFPTFIGSLAKKLGIIKERVALRGEEVLDFVTFPDETYKKDSTLVTPIGICLNYYERKNNIIFVTVNDERLKMYDNGRLAVVDAAIKLGYPHDKLFPRRGQSLNFTLNGEKKVVRGEPGEAALITVNSKLASINTPIVHHDRIVIKPSTSGSAARKKLSELREVKNDKIRFIVNGEPVACPRLYLKGETPIGTDYRIEDGDVLNKRDYYLVLELLAFLKLGDYAIVKSGRNILKENDKITESSKVEIKV